MAEIASRGPLPPFVEFHNGINSYDVTTCRDDERDETGIVAAGINAALCLVVHRGR